MTIPTAAGVAILIWPEESEALGQLADERTPRLFLVEAGTEPPVAAECCQDWMWRTGSPHELRLRLRQLSLRAMAHAHARPHIDSAGLLHVGLRSLPLTAKEQRMMAVLVEAFDERVTAAELLAAGWPDGVPRTTLLAPRVSILRKRLRAMGLELSGSSRNGYTLRPSRDAVAPASAECFDDELDVRAWLRPQAEEGRASG